MKVGKMTRSFRYDLNQIPYDYTVEVTTRFKRLGLIDRVPEEDLQHCTGGRDQNHYQENKNARKQCGFLKRFYK